MAEAGAGRDRARVGLCADCRYARPIKSDRASIFWRCELSTTNRNFPKYPRLPVLSCTGHEPIAADPGGQQDTEAETD